MFSSELKKGSIEMLILSLLDAKPSHGYEIGKAIETRSGGRLTFALPTLYPTLLRLEIARLDQGTLGRETRRTESLLLQAHRRGTPRPAGAARHVGSLRRRRAAGDGSRRCVTGNRSFVTGCGCPA